MSQQAGARLYIEAEEGRGEVGDKGAMIQPSRNRKNKSIINGRCGRDAELCQNNEEEEHEE